MPVTTTCAQASRDHAEPLAGTAPVARGWFLVEQPGPWGRNALTASRLPVAVGQALKDACSDLPVRPQLIRRRAGASGGGSAPRLDGPTLDGPTLDGPTADDARGRAMPRQPARTVVLAHTGATPWAEVLTLHDPRTLLDLDPARCLEPEPPGIGRPLDVPLFLVCTHAKRDRCCATWGRPIVDTLAALHPAMTWEISHIGGHRFAGNLVTLPDGAVYGGLDVASAVQVAAAHLAGRIEPEHLRGRSGLARPIQAAEVAVRRALGRTGADEVTVPDQPEPEVPTDPDTVVTVDLDVAGRRHHVRLRRLPSGTARLLSCDRDEPEDPAAYEAVSVEPAREPAG